VQPETAPDGRRERSRRTRRAIVLAAIDLFVADGYGSTTINAIAERAGVAVQTVYVSFGSKRAILSAALDQAIAGDDREVAVNDRDWMHDVFNAPTARERLTAYAGGLRRILEQAGDMFAVVAAAASIEPDVIELAETTEARRLIGARSVVEAAAAVGPLRDGVTIDEAVDVLSLINSPATFHHLVRRRGWSLDRYQAWVADALHRELLPPI
jgi:AcrR family transcriptional regulator